MFVKNLQRNLIYSTESRNEPCNLIILYYFIIANEPLSIPSFSYVYEIQLNFL